jgi:hypothetical protein
MSTRSTFAGSLSYVLTCRLRTCGLWWPFLTSSSHHWQARALFVEKQRCGYDDEHFLTRLISGLFRLWREYTQLSEKAVRIPQRYLDPTAEGQKTRQVRRAGSFSIRTNFPRLYFLGIIMSMHLLTASGGATRMADRALSLITSYENGSVKLWQYHNIEKERSIEGVGWECIWSFKLHVESGKRSVHTTFIVPAPCRASYNLHICATVITVMATAVSLDRSIALSVSADHLVGRYDVNVCALTPTSSQLRYI